MQASALPRAEKVASHGSEMNLSTRPGSDEWALLSQSMQEAVLAVAESRVRALASDIQVVTSACRLAHQEQLTCHVEACQDFTSLLRSLELARQERGQALQDNRQEDEEDVQEEEEGGASSEPLPDLIPTLRARADLYATVTAGYCRDAGRGGTTPLAAVPPSPALGTEAHREGVLDCLAALLEARAEGEALARRARLRQIRREWQEQALEAVRAACGPQRRAQDARARFLAAHGRARGLHMLAQAGGGTTGAPPSPSRQPPQPLQPLSARSLSRPTMEPQQQGAQAQGQGPEGEELARLAERQARRLLRQEMEARQASLSSASAALAALAAEGAARARACVAQGERAWGEAQVQVQGVEEAGRAAVREAAAKVQEVRERVEGLARTVQLLECKRAVRTLLLSRAGQSHAPTLAALCLSCLLALPPSPWLEGRLRGALALMKVAQRGAGAAAGREAAGAGSSTSSSSSSGSTVVGRARGTARRAVLASLQAQAGRGAVPLPARLAQGRRGTLAGGGGAASASATTGTGTGSGSAPSLTPAPLPTTGTPPTAGPYAQLVQETSPVQPRGSAGVWEEVYSSRPRARPPQAPPHGVRWEDQQGGGGGQAEGSAHGSGGEE